MCLTYFIGCLLCSLLNLGLRSGCVQCQLGMPLLTYGALLLHFRVGWPVKSSFWGSGRNCSVYMQLDSARWRWTIESSFRSACCLNPECRMHLSSALDNFSFAGVELTHEESLFMSKCLRVALYNSSEWIRRMKHLHLKFRVTLPVVSALIKIKYVPILYKSFNVK